jgi:hypothetical protein
MRRPRAGARRRPDAERDARSLTPEPLPSSRGPATSSVTSSATSSSSAVGTPATEGSSQKVARTTQDSQATTDFPERGAPLHPRAPRFQGQPATVYSALERREITYEAGGPEEPASAEQTPRPTPHEGYDVAGDPRPGGSHERAPPLGRARCPLRTTSRRARQDCRSSVRAGAAGTVETRAAAARKFSGRFSCGRGGRVCRSSAAASLDAGAARVLDRPVSRKGGTYGPCHGRLPSF